MNDFANRPDGELQTRGLATAARLAEGDYPLDAAVVARVVEAADAYRAERLVLWDALTSYRGAVAAKDAARAALVEALGEAAGILVRNPEVSDAALQGAGFARRPPRTPRPTLAQTVTGLTFGGGPSGELRLAWERGANGRSTIFEVEIAEGDGPFVHALATTRTRCVLHGRPAGSSLSVRVVATTSISRATPSNAIVPYAGAGVSARAA